MTLLLKILIASVIVIGLAELAERSSTKMAGILAGLPVGSALVLFFYGLDFGAVYVDKVTPYNLLGLSASLSFVTFYYLGTTLSDRFSMLFGIFLGLSAYLLIAYLLSFIRWRIHIKLPVFRGKYWNRLCQIKISLVIVCLKLRSLWGVRATGQSCSMLSSN